MNENTIKTIIDKYLDKWSELKLNKLPIAIEAEMADPEQDKNEEWRTWHAVTSKVTNDDLDEFESDMGFKLPEDYRTLLKHKHFYDLPIAEASFCPHPVNTWKDHHTDMVFNGYSTEFLLDSGYLPFAEWSDWGILCFDTNENTGDNNYPVVLWDNEAEDEVRELYPDFCALMIGLDELESQG